MFQAVTKDVVNDFKGDKNDSLKRRLTLTGQIDVVYRLESMSSSWCEQRSVPLVDWGGRELK
ncbi:hypothetical protein BgiBS90_015550, partial [Biomphalaria glabrata]